MQISIIIPNYNGKEILEKNFSSVFESLEDYLERNKVKGEIIFVDDASIDRSVAFLKEISATFSNKNIEIKIIINKKNLGFSSTANNGAFAAQGEFLVFLNTDVIPEKGFLDPVIKDFKQDEKLFGVGFMDKSIENNKIILRGRGLGFWQQGFILHRKGDTEKRKTFWISGGSSCIKREIFLKLNGFDTIYNPFYWEDIDLSYRAQKMGFKLLFENKSIVIHKHFEGAIKKHYSEKKIKIIAYRNQFIFIWKNITDFNLIFLHFIWLPINLARAVLTGEKDFICGFFLALKSIPDIIFKRQKQRELYVLRDKDVLKREAGN